MSPHMSDAEAVEEARKAARAEYYRRHHVKDHERVVLVLAVICALVMAAGTGGSVYSLIRLDRAVTDAEQASEDSAAAVERIRESRATTTYEFCQKLNSNARRSNRLTSYLEQLVVQGTRQSRVFEPLYRQYGFPPYPERLRRAQETASEISKRKTKLIDCEKRIEELRRDG